MRHVILIAAAIMATSPAWADDKLAATTIGWGIGCGCSRTDVDTMIKYMGRVIFLDASEAELKSLAGNVKQGEKNSREGNNSDTICPTICSQHGDMFKIFDDTIEALE